MTPLLPSHRKKLADLLAALGPIEAEYSPRLGWANQIWIGVGVFIGAIATGVPPIAFFGLLAILLLWKWSEDKTILICKGGIVVTRWLKVESCRWEEIANLQYSVATAATSGLAAYSERHAILVRWDSSVLILNYLPSNLIKTLEAEIYTRLSPPLLELFDRGEMVFFADVGVDREGIRYRNESIGWDEVKRVEFAERVVVYKLNGMVWKRFKPLPNVGVLKAIAERLGKGSEPPWLCCDMIGSSKGRATRCQ